MFFYEFSITALGMSNEHLKWLDNLLIYSNLFIYVGVLLVIYLDDVMIDSYIFA